MGQSSLLHLMRIANLFILLGLASTAVAAQDVYGVVYRPDDAQYWKLRSEHFEIIFEEGLGEQADDAVQVLETTLDDAAALVGVRAGFRMPVVLNRSNDLSNGFVSPLVFRQEIEGVSLKGTLVDPGFPTWMHAVLPHELVHALHAEIRPRFGFGGVLSLFAPDLSRALNFSIPLGMTEGSAVYLESNLYPDVGRLHHGYFRMRYRAGMERKRPWRLAQMLEPPVYTKPYDRYYLGGSLVFDALARRYGTDFFRRSVGAYNRWPFFGYGFALWLSTGDPPWKIGREIRRAFGSEAAPTLGEPAPGARTVATKRGTSHYRPLWVDSSVVVVYVDGYEIRPGYYRVNVDSGRRTLVSHQAVTEDYYASLSPDRKQLYFSRYHPDLHSRISWRSDVHRLDLATGRSERLTSGLRAYAPVWRPDSVLWAVRNRDQFTDWVAVEGGEAIELFGGARAVVREMAPRPGTSETAVAMGIEGHSAIFFGREWGSGALPRVVAASYSAGFYDLSWSPEGRYLIFSTDVQGVPAVYAWDALEDRYLRLTSAAFGALQGSISPDGARLAFVEYRDERRDLVVAPFRPADALSVERDLFTRAADLPWLEMMKAKALPGSNPAVRKYRALRPVPRPRMVYPTLSREERVSASDGLDLGYAFGVGVEGADPLETWAYGLRAYRQAGSFWGDASIRTAAVWWRPGLRVYRRPVSQRILLVDRSGAGVDTVRVGREEVAVEASATAPLTLRANVFNTSALVGLGARLRRVRFFDGNLALLDPYPAARSFSTRLTLSPSVAFANRVHARPRDIMVSRGWILRSSAELDVWTHAGSGSGAIPRPGRSWITTWSYYRIVLPGYLPSLRLQLGALLQNRGSIFDLDSFLPRGYRDDLYLGSGTFWKAGLQTMVPLAFIDNGFVVLPAYFEVVYAYAFLEAVATRTLGSAWSSAGGGLGIDLRVAHTIPLRLRIGLAWQVEEGKAVLVFR